MDNVDTPLEEVDYAKFFAENKYVVVKEALHPDVAKLAAQYAVFDSFQFFNHAQGDPVEGSHGRYADPLMESLLMQLRPLVEDVTGLTLWPTSSFYRLYEPGQELLKHVDRPSCEISLTMNLGFGYNTDDKDYRWNIWMDGKEFETNPGDMVVYRGCEVEHWREKFDAPEGSWHAQAFLHYVDANGPYSFCKYDARPQLGFPGSASNQEILDFSYNVRSENKYANSQPTSILYLKSQKPTSNE
jgi:hypothetical protein